MRFPQSHAVFKAKIVSALRTGGFALAHTEDSSLDTNYVPLTRNFCFLPPVSRPSNSSKTASRAESKAESVEVPLSNSTNFCSPREDADANKKARPGWNKAGLPVALRKVVVTRPKVLE